jgi:hypothetical protein
MIKELKDLKPTVDVLAPEKMKSSRGGVRMFTIFGCSWNPPEDPTQGGTDAGGPTSGGHDSCTCACAPSS